MRGRSTRIPKGWVQATFTVNCPRCGATNTSEFPWWPTRDKWPTNFYTMFQKEHRRCRAAKKRDEAIATAAAEAQRQETIRRGIAVYQRTQAAPTPRATFIAWLRRLQKRGRHDAS